MINFLPQRCAYHEAVSLFGALEKNTNHSEVIRELSQATLVSFVLISFRPRVKSGLLNEDKSQTLMSVLR